MPRVLAGRWGPILAVLIGTALGAVLGACSSGVLWVPGPAEPGPGLPPPPPPPPAMGDPEPPPSPGPVPGQVAAVLERIRIGATRAEAIAAVGSAPEPGPSGGAGPELLRWFVAEAEARFLVWAAVEAGVVTGKGSSPVEVVR